MGNEQILNEMWTSEKFRSITRNICGKQFVNTSGDLHSEVVLHIIEEGDDLSELNDSTHYFAYHALRIIRRDYSIAKKYNINISNHYQKISNETTIWGEVDNTPLDSFEGSLSISLDKYDEFNEIKDIILSSEPKSMREDFKRKLWRIYEMKGSYREVKKELPSIPARLINETLQEFKNEVLKQIQDRI